MHGFPKCCVWIPTAQDLCHLTTANRTEIRFYFGAKSLGANAYAGVARPYWSSRGEK